MSKTFNPEIFKRWASLGKETKQLRKPARDWLAVRRMIVVTKPVLQANRDEAKRLLEQSKRYFEPLTDPFEMDFGLHRWLQQGREEAYSDWLAWILEQLSTADEIIKLFLAEDSNGLLTKCKGKKATILRENLRCGTDGQRRTDIEIIFGNQNAIVVEVKLIDAADVEQKQLHDLTNYTPGFAHRLLLVPSAEIDMELEQFKLLLWQDLCIRLRKTIPALSRANLTAAAMTLAFVGAVEQNILGFPRQLKQRILQGQLVNSDALDYLKRTLQKGE